MKWTSVVLTTAWLLQAAYVPCAARESAILKGSEINPAQIKAGMYVNVTYASETGQTRTARGYIETVRKKALVVMYQWPRTIAYKDIITLRIVRSERHPIGAPAADFEGLVIGERFAVDLLDGSQVVGELKSRTSDELTLITSFGEAKVACSRVKALTPLTAEDIHGGEYWHPDPNRTRAFVFPTASVLPRGKGFYENYYILFNSVHYGVSDRMMVSSGFVPFSEAIVLSFGPKFQVYQNREKTAEAAVGAQVFVGTGDGESSALLVPYGVLSFGKSGKARLSIGTGGILERNGSAFLLNMSSDYRLNRRLKLMGEVFALLVEGERHILPIYGLRFFSEKLAFDLGFWNIPGEQDFMLFGTPFANFVFSF